MQLIFKPMSNGKSLLSKNRCEATRSPPSGQVDATVPGTVVSESKADSELRVGERITLQEDDRNRSVAFLPGV